jgi:uncharacterized membrane protein YhaH (DUF805 family)
MTYSLFDPRGRLRRLDYVPTFVIVNLASLGTRGMVLDGIAGRTALFMATMFVAWTMFCTMSKRLHDAGMTCALAAANVAMVSTAGTLLQFGSIENAYGAAAIILALAAAVGLYVAVAPPSAKGARYGWNPRTVPKGVEVEREVTTDLRIDAADRS